MHTISTVVLGLDFEWDKGKACRNTQKHGVGFPDAALVLSDEFALTDRDDSKVEDRYVTLGMDPLGRVLVVVYTFRGDKIRLISARKATRRERQQYEECR